MQLFCSFIQIEFKMAMVAYVIETLENSLENKALYGIYNQLLTPLIIMISEEMTMKLCLVWPWTIMTICLMVICRHSA